jgi:hypothetical protein
VGKTPDLRPACQVDRHRWKSLSTHRQRRHKQQGTPARPDVASLEDASIKPEKWALNRG